eukprot:Gb_41515 [translate_table: standard]
MRPKEQPVVDAQIGRRKNKEQQKIAATNKKAQKKKPSKSESSTPDRASSSTIKGSKKEKKTPSMQVPMPRKEEKVEVLEEVSSRTLPEEEEDSLEHKEKANEDPLANNTPKINKNNENSP